MVYVVRSKTHQTLSYKMYDLSTNTISQSQVLTRNQSSENVEFNSSVIDIDCLRNTDLTLKCAIAESETE